jgi:hypothetical protein
MYAAGASATSVAAALFFENLWTIAATCAIAVVTTAVRERMRRREFDARWDLAEAAAPASVWRSAGNSSS